MSRTGFKRILSFLFLSALLCALAGGGALSQETGAPVSEAPAQQSNNAPRASGESDRLSPSNIERDTAQLKALVVRLQSIEAALNRIQITDEELGALRDRTDRIDLEATGIREARRERIDWLTAVIQELTLPDGTPIDESSDLFRQRQLLQDELSALAGISKQAEAISFTAS
ncbi:MAG: hypothetical protein MI923_04980 [Phycisphaerales bacterium]|nr:hypothetical protein [Phycisphaerales bacterium]